MKKILTLTLILFLLNGCTIGFGKIYETDLKRKNNAIYHTNCEKLFMFQLLFYIIPLPSWHIGECDEIYLRTSDGDLSILHNNQTYSPIKLGEYYKIKIDVNDLKKDKNAKILQKGVAEPVNLYQSSKWEYDHT